MRAELVKGMPKEMESGKAFEYALATKLFDKIQQNHETELVKNSSYENAQKCFGLFSLNDQQEYASASTSVIDRIVNLEPRLVHPVDSNDSIRIHIQSDNAGVMGDARDIIATSSVDHWQVGFSAKNKHRAVKHSRLSDKIDFGSKWCGIPCSEEYMAKVSKIFGELREIAKTSRGISWKELQNKEMKYYVPTLKAFEDEICRLAQIPDVPKRMVEYLVGTNDYYKVMKYEKHAVIQGFNMYGTLSMLAGNIRPNYKVQRLNLPSRIIKTEMERQNTVVIMFNHGWTLSFRIHNARTRVEPSLKFDIQLVGTPNSMYADQVYW